VAHALARLPAKPAADPDARDRVRRLHHLRRRLRDAHSAERRELLSLYDRGEINGDVLDRVLADLDLELLRLEGEWQIFE
jgi:O-phosphoseryl-tRNA(Cys) synthetase